MMKGIWFDDVHSYNNLNLVLSNFIIPPAAAKTNYIDIPGSDGSVDLTEALGEVKYGDRDCSFTFTVFPYDDFEQKKTEVSNLLNGKRCKIKVDKDPGYYWDGRCHVNEYASDKNIHQITVTARVAPYKYKTKVTEVSVPAGNSVTVNLKNGRKSVVPKITTTADATVIFGGKTFELGIGTYMLLDILLVYGINTMTVTSTAPVIFTYQEGDL